MTEELRKEARKNALEAKAHYENTCRQIKEELAKKKLEMRL